MVILSVLFTWLAMRRGVDVDVETDDTVLAPPTSDPPLLRLVSDHDRTVAFRRQGTSLEGTAWRLLPASKSAAAAGTISMPFGRHPVGQLVYMPNGRMSVMLMAGNRASFGSHGLGAGTGPEKAAAFDSFLAYSGRYERFENRVIHHPDVASIPDFVGVPEERFVALEGDRLTLSTPPMLENGQARTFAVVWERVRAAGRAHLRAA